MYKKIYLSGPEVFLFKAEKFGEKKKKLCDLYGFEGVFPLDNKLVFASDIPQERGLEIAAENEKLIKSSDILIANMTPFRGPSCDVGTAYEMGFARALKIPVFAYTNDSQLFLDRSLYALENCHRVSEQHYVDDAGMTIENFGLVDNLMLEGALTRPISTFSYSQDTYQDLLAFEQCLRNVLDYVNTQKINITP